MTEITWLDLVSTFELDRNDIVLEVQKNWGLARIPCPAFCNFDRLTGSDFLKMLKALGVNSGDYYGLGYLAKYPSIVCAIAIIDPRLILDGVAGFKDPAFYRILRDCFDIAYKIERCSGFQFRQTVGSSLDLGFYTFDVFPIETSKSFDNRPVIKIHRDPEKIHRDNQSFRRMLNKQARFKVKRSDLRPDHSPLSFFRDPTQGRFICIETENRSTHVQVNWLLEHGPRLAGQIEVRQCNTAIGDRSVYIVGIVYADKKGKIKYRIDRMPESIDKYCLHTLLPRLGMMDFVLGKECSLRNIYKGSILLESKLWSDLRFKRVQIDSENRFLRVLPIVETIPSKEETEDTKMKPDPIVSSRKKAIVTYSRVDTITDWESFKASNLKPTITINPLPGEISSTERTIEDHLKMKQKIWHCPDLQSH